MLKKMSVKSLNSLNAKQLEGGEAPPTAYRMYVLVNFHWPFFHINQGKVVSHSSLSVCPEFSSSGLSVQERRI